VVDVVVVVGRDRNGGGRWQTGEFLLESVEREPLRNLRVTQTPACGLRQELPLYKPPRPRMAGGAALVLL
jgi:hypothetical protein